MMISGKSALRKKRFKREASRSGYQCLGGYRRFAPGGYAPLTGLGPVPDLSGVEDAHVRQVPVALGEVEPVPDDEAVRDLEADVAHGYVDLASLGLRQQRADLQARRLARLEVA